MKNLTVKLTYACVGVIAVSGLAWFALDGAYSDRPTVPDLATGRTISHLLRLHPTVYLTPSEYIPYDVIHCAMGLAAVSGVLFYLIDYIKLRRSKNRR